jgi:hypothetical protein
MNGGDLFPRDREVRRADDVLVVKDSLDASILRLPAEIVKVDSAPSRYDPADVPEVVGFIPMPDEPVEVVVSVDPAAAILDWRDVGRFMDTGRLVLFTIRLRLKGRVGPQRTSELGP